MSTQDYIVKDMSLAPWGRKEIEIAESEIADRFPTAARRVAAFIDHRVSRYVGVAAA